MNSKEAIKFYKPFYSSRVKEFLLNAFESGTNSLFSGRYAKRCYDFIIEKYQCEDVVFTPSCTDALSMATLLLGLKQGDEVIIPSYTFVSVATAFVNRGIKIRLADSQQNHPNIDPNHVRSLLNENTKAIVFMYYGGQANGIEEVKKISEQFNIPLIGDAAHAFNSKHNNQYIGTFSDLATFSFHETKNISCGQGGMLLINNKRFLKTIPSVQNHGSNRHDLKNGVVTQYNWVSLGGEFNLPELSCALLYSQFLEHDNVRLRFKALWEVYYYCLLPLQKERFISVPHNVQPESNYYIFYIILKSDKERQELIKFLGTHFVKASFHYTGLHNSDFYIKNYGKLELPNCDKFAQCLLRLPLYPELTLEDAHRVGDIVKNFFYKQDIVPQTLGATTMD